MQQLSFSLRATKKASLPSVGKEGNLSPEAIKREKGQSHPRGLGLVCLAWRVGGSIPG